MSATTPNIFQRVAWCASDDDDDYFATLREELGEAQAAGRERDRAAREQAALMLRYNKRIVG